MSSFAVPAAKFLELFFMRNKPEFVLLVLRTGEGLMVLVTLWCLPCLRRNPTFGARFACRRLSTTPRQEITDTSCFRMWNDSELASAAIEIKTLAESGQTRILPDRGTSTNIARPERYDSDLEDWAAYLTE